IVGLDLFSQHFTHVLFVVYNDNVQSIRHGVSSMVKISVENLFILIRHTKNQIIIHWSLKKALPGYSAIRMKSRIHGRETSYDCTMQVERSCQDNQAAEKLSPGRHRSR
ncbi:MAG TPA: hypothetical protein PLM29_12615, partial [Deltaproteobacteria bacterium]|nr:hypothetical protein [Deltaproteobacteria bacterium]